MQLTFLGGADGVTGSAFLVRSRDGCVLVDCGLFQGLKAHRLRNWEPLPLAVEELDAVLLTHAHLDHSGRLPLLVRAGFRGPIYATSGTRALCGVLLPDAGHLQEEEAAYRNRTGTTRHHPALPLFTADDARATLPRFRVVPLGEAVEVAPGLEARFSPAGHLLGAASIRLQDDDGSVLFSGDLGRASDPLFRAPAPPPAADALVVESTYGDRLHPADADPEAELAAVVTRTAERGGVVVVPAFAVGRVQLVLHLLARLADAGRIPTVPVFVDSPMATEATRIFCTHTDEHRLSEADCERLCRHATFVRTPDESKRLDRGSGSAVIVSSSGMATGGRVLHHLKAFLGDPRHTVLLTGFQAAGTRGEALLRGADRLKIHGAWWPVRAEVRYLRGVSGHADRDELLAWLDRMPGRPRSTWVVHGEPRAQDALRLAIADRLRWETAVPGHGHTVRL